MRNKVFVEQTGHDPDLGFACLCTSHVCVRCSNYRKLKKKMIGVVINNVVVPVGRQVCVECERW